MSSTRPSSPAHSALAGIADAKRQRLGFALQPLLLIFAAVSVGLVSGLAPTATAVVTGALMLAAAVLTQTSRLTWWVLMAVIGIPSGWSITSLLPLHVALLGVTAPLTILVPVVVGGLAAASLPLVPWLHTHRLTRSARSILIVTGIWLVLGLTLLMRGAWADGLLPAMRDGQYVFLWGWAAAVVMAAISPKPLNLRSASRAVLLGATIYSIVVLLIFMMPDSVRATLFASEYDSTASTFRVGFGNGSALTLVLPLVVVLVALEYQSVTRRVWAGGAGVLMLAGLLVSQSRMVLVISVLNCLLAWLVVGSPGVTSRRARVVAYSVVAVAGIALCLALMSSMGSDRAGALPDQLVGRLLSSGGETDRSLQTRLHTVSAAWETWNSSPESVAVGQGLGTQLGLSSPSGVQIGEQLLVDNVWAVLAVKGGLAALLAFAAMVTTFGVVLVRAARRAPPGTRKAIWRAMAVSYPGFVAGTTLLVSHLYSSPAVILTFTTICTLAAFERGDDDAR